MKQILTNGFYGPLITAADAIRYNGIESGGIWDEAENHRYEIVPVSGTLKNFYVYLTSAPGAAGSGKSYTFTVMKEGVATGLTVTISETATSGSIELDVAFVAGNTISIKCVTSHTVPTASYAKFTSLFETSDNSSMILGCTGSTFLHTTNTRYCLINSQYSTNYTTESCVAIPVPYSGTISNFYVETSASPGDATKWYGITLMKSGSPSTVSVVIQNASTTSYDIAHSISVSAGDTLSIRCSPTGTPTAVHAAWGFVFNSDKEDTSIICGGTYDTMYITNTTPMYHYINMGYDAGAESNTEVQKINYLQNCRLSDLRLKIITAPGVGKSYTFNVRKNAADTGLFHTIQDSETTGYNTKNNVSFSLGDYTTLQMVANGTPTASSPYWSCLCRYEEVPDGPYFTVSTDEDYGYIPMINSLSFGDSKDIQFFNFRTNLDETPIFSNIDVGKDTENISITGDIFYEDKDKLDWLLDASYKGKDITLSGFDNDEIDDTWTIESFNYSGSFSTPSMYIWSMQLEKTY